MARSGVWSWRVLGLVIGSLLLWRAQASAIPLDKDETIKFEARTYVNARVGTQTTQDGPPDTADTLLSKGTFPTLGSGAPEAEPFVHRSGDQPRSHSDGQDYGCV